jgi:hypoxanthine phosphoribosyltransferase
MSEVITIKDKQFKPYIPEQKIVSAVKTLAAAINSDLKNEFPLFLAVLNGSFMFAADLLREITIPCEVSFVKLASYEGMSSSGSVTELIGLTENISGRTVVILEDVVDSGLTLQTLTALLVNRHVKKIKTATVLFKPDVYKSENKPDYIGFSIPNNFVVGYGLDYDGLGRNLKEIHVLV